MRERKTKRGRRRGHTGVSDGIPCELGRPTSERGASPRHLLFSTIHLSNGDKTTSRTQQSRSLNPVFGPSKRRRRTHQIGIVHPRHDHHQHQYLAAEALLYAERDGVHGGGYNRRRHGSFRPSRCGLARRRDGHEVVFLDERVEHVLALGGSSKLHPLWLSPPSRGVARDARARGGRGELKKRLSGSNEIGSFQLSRHKAVRSGSLQCSMLTNNG